jgi:hypothetical protein
VIWVRREQEYFCERGWTAKSLICPTGQIRKGAELALSSQPRYLQSSAAKRQDLAGTNGLHTSFLMASIFRSRLLNCGRSMSACDSLADSNHTRRHVRKVPTRDSCAAANSMTIRSSAVVSKRASAVVPNRQLVDRRQTGFDVGISTAST